MLDWFCCFLCYGCMIMFNIRTASKNFLCEKCNTLIPNGTEYFDSWEYNTKSGTYWHRRFHKECVCNNKNVTNDDSVLSSVTRNNSTQLKANNIFDRVQKLIERENGSLIIAKDGIKCYVNGVGYNDEDERVFLCETWEDKKPFFETADNMKKYIDYNGNYL